MSSTNRGKDRHLYDYYKTPYWCVSELYRCITLPEPTLDPCAGDGGLMLAWPRMRGIELNPALVRRAPDHIDIIHGDGLEASWLGHNVLMNPPYGKAEAWIEKGCREAYSMVALLRLGYLSSKKRQAFWQANPPSAVVILSKRPSFTADGKSDSADYCWIYWGKQACQGVQVAWISPAS
tara:strand:+ start:562 stop:1098 length:537 start_codon:yes stop_codon:yes gene_type:complete